MDRQDKIGAIFTEINKAPEEKVNLLYDDLVAYKEAREKVREAIKKHKVKKSIFD